MPITKSAKKALRQNIKRKAQNVKRKQTYKDLVKQEERLISQNKTEEAKKLLPQLYKALDKAVKTNVLQANTASRKKSRFTRLIQKGATQTKKTTAPTA